VPRNIDPAVRHVDNAFLFDIDDLNQRVEQNRAERLQEAEKAEHMVLEEVGVLRDWMKSLQVTPTITALRNRVDEIKQSEVEKTLGRLAHLSPGDRELVEGMASSIVNKLIHSTMVTLKSEVNSSSGAAFVEAARRFFNLEEPSGESRRVGHLTGHAESPEPRPEDATQEEAPPPPVRLKRKV
jgi:glutamyl-tRNA reductase